MIDFALPQFFLAALVLPFVVALKIWADQQGARGLNAFVAKRLQRELVRRVPAGADWFLFSLQMLGVLCLITAAARPQWGFQEIETITEGRNVFVAIDTSRSMLATDVAPNRLERAKRAAQDLVRNLSSDRVGLVAFAGRPFILAPLTVDHDAVLEAIDQLDTEVVPRGGTNLAKPALMALEAMAEAETSLAALVIFSDGEDLEGGPEQEEFHRKAADSGLLVISVGVGTEGGAILPDQESGPGHFVRDEAGQVVRSRLSLDGLRRLSDWTGGICVNLGEHASVSQVVEEALRRLEAQRLQARETRVPVERYAIPLVIGLVLLVLSHVSPMVWFSRPFRFRPRVATVAGPAVGMLALGWLLPAENAGAGDEGWALYRQGRYMEAQARYMDQIARSRWEGDRRRFSFGLGAAAFRSGDYEGAKHAFAEALLSSDVAMQEQSHFNLGNTLFEAGRKLFPKDIAGTIGQLESAERQYEAALQRNGANREAATRNLEFVRDLLEKLRQLPPAEDQPKANPDQNPPPNEPDKPEPPDPQTPPPDRPSPPPSTPETPPDLPPPQNWSAEEARRILENNADEDKNVKPPQVMKFEPGGFRNW